MTIFDSIAYVLVVAGSFWLVIYAFRRGPS